MPRQQREMSRDATQFNNASIRKNSLNTYQINPKSSKIIQIIGWKITLHPLPPHFWLHLFPPNFACSLFVGPVLDSARLVGPGRWSPTRRFTTPLRTDRAAFRADPSGAPVGLGSRGTATGRVSGVSGVGRRKSDPSWEFEPVS